MLARNLNIMDWAFYAGAITILVFVFKTVLELLTQFQIEFYFPR